MTQKKKIKEWVQDAKEKRLMHIIDHYKEQRILVLINKIE